MYVDLNTCKWLSNIMRCESGWVLSYLPLLQWLTLMPAFNCSFSPCRSIFFTLYWYLAIHISHCFLLNCFKCQSITFNLIVIPAGDDTCHLFTYCTSVYLQWNTFMYGHSTGHRSWLIWSLFEQMSNKLKQICHFSLGEQIQNIVTKSSFLYCWADR